jgi:DNA adenine methylase
MSDCVIGYPGGKTYLASWINDHFPDHRTYIEPFGGGGSVLINKPKSDVEIYNDQDGDVVQFFKVLREHTSDLVEWCRSRPYAKDLHEKYAHQFYAGYRPDDPVERAGRFFYLRHTQFSAKYTGYSGFSSSSQSKCSMRYFNGVDELEQFAERLHNVQIENRDYRDLFSRFDSDDVLWYCDPPYIDEGDSLYTGNAFSHQEFCDELSNLNGDFCVSYTDVPEQLQQYNIVERDAAQQMSKSQSKRSKTERTERLVMNYDIDERAKFHRSHQQTFSVI